MLRSFLKKHEGGMRGWIVDVRGHSGGDIYPLQGLQSLFGDAVSFAWSNVPEPVTRGRQWTGSAGEAAAAMLWGKPTVRSFGEDTSGFLSGNMVRSVGRDGAELVLAEVCVVTTSDGTFRCG